MPVNQDKAPWTRTTLALLGKMPDGQLAKLVGCTRQAVELRRRKAGIPSPVQNVRPPKWGQTELGLLRNFTDAEVAKITGRTLGEIAAKRKE